MGFNGNPTTYALEFDHPELQGLKVRVRRGSVQLRNDYDDAEKWQERLAIFASVLVEWNIEIDGVPVPMTVEGMTSLEDTVLLPILQAWMEARRPTAPLEQPSTPGVVESTPPPETRDLDLEASIGMTPLAS
ncbi:hypothetical protein ACFWIW_10650 [Amycolatopsis sp. NPDC058340]|uniref:hypothetical protein n=1 Tax=Amycolatopsis sp. NPDC058340 TaxID=3346453 RepID=UPI003647EEDE